MELEKTKLRKIKGVEQRNVRPSLACKGVCDRYINQRLATVACRTNLVLALLL